jgi:hypothetical protein
LAIAVVKGELAQAEAHLRRAFTKTGGGTIRGFGAFVRARALKEVSRRGEDLLRAGMPGYERLPDGGGLFPFPGALKKTGVAHRRGGIL